VLVIHDEIDLRSARSEHASAVGSRAQRAQALSASSAAASSPACGWGSGGGPTDPEIVAAYVLGRFREPADEVAELVGRASDAATAIRRGG